ncbi:MAG: hypothetical protein EB078_11880, partial [Proteobacteria bacterium]|nr:hypothetical protein [Pseudomonadota bacterium]
IFLLHNPQGPSATIIGGGSDSPRVCEGEAALLSQDLECAPMAEETWVDEQSKCKISKVFVEHVLFKLTTGLRYSRTEIVVLSDETPKECTQYKRQLTEELEKEAGPDFYKAMKAAGIISDNEQIPDLFALAHIYETSPSDKKVFDYPEGNQTGAYDLEYAQSSQTASWTGEEKRDLQISEAFNADGKTKVEKLDTVLLFHDHNKQELKVSGGGVNKMRECKNISTAGSPEEVYACTLFRAKEEEAGTGCTIEHWIFERVTLRSKEAPQYARVEQRHLMENTAEGCQNYRTKITSELKEGSAESFFRLIHQTGGFSTSNNLGDTFQLVHDYTATPVE